MSPRSNHHARTFKTLGAYIPTKLAERVAVDAAARGLSPSAWAKEALLEKLDREESPSILPEIKEREKA